MVDGASTYDHDVEPTVAILGPVRSAFGLTQRWLRIIGLLTWAVAGSTSIIRFATHPEGAARWVAAYAAFGGLFWITSDNRASRVLRLSTLTGQGVLAIVLAFLGMPMFEGALLALVAAQVPTVLPLWASVPWAVAQVVPLWVVISRSYDRVETTKSITSYLGFSAFAIGAVYLFEAERRARLELDRTIRELVATRTLLAESTRVAERMDIARELHDVLGHKLMALILKLDLARRTADDRTRASLDEHYASAQEMLAAIRKAVGELRVKPIDLGAALRNSVESFPGLEVKLDAPEVLTVEDPDRSLAAFRCVQEAVTNVAKYASASTVHITVKRAQGDLEIRVQDNGRGIGDVKPGHGLRGMRERIEGAGGTLEISNAPDGGTIVLAHIPLEDAK